MDRVNDDNSGSVVIHGSQIIPSNLYKAAATGNIQHFMENTTDTLEVLATPIKDTILHLYIASPSQTEKAADFVEQILDKCPSLLMQVNDRSDTPLHLAAKLGHLAVVKVLIQRATDNRDDLESNLRDGEPDAKQRMLREKNNLGNTALHEAVTNYYPDVVELLTKEDPDYSYSANDSGESPLFIATEGGFLRMVDIILTNCRSPSPEGPDGKTALHVAVSSNNLGITKKLLDKNGDLTKARDKNGWTPLHYAAYYGCHISIVKDLLRCDNYVAFVRDKDRKMTPLHLAAGQGYVKIMKEIILCRPDCCEMVDIKGWNFLHFALAALPHIGLDVLFDEHSNFNLLKNLVNAKDREGNTPLHVYAVCRPYLVSELISQMSHEVRGDALNKENDSIIGTGGYGSPKLQKEIEELKVIGNGPYRKGIIRSHNRWTSDFITRIEKAREAPLVTAALVATVTFTAALTVPGGFDQKEGTSLLTKNAAFQAFILTDAIAMIFSLFAVFLHFVIILDLHKYGHMFPYTIFATIIAIIAMVIAFVTGTYATLTPSSWLAVATTCIGLSFFLLLLGMARVQFYHFKH